MCLKYKTAINAIFLYLNLCLCAKLDSLSCSVAPTFFITTVKHAGVATFI